MIVGRKPYQLNLGQHQERWLISSPRLLRFLPRESWKCPTLKQRMGTQFWDMSNRNEDSLRSNVVTLHFWGLQWVKWCYFSALMLYKLYIYIYIWLVSGTYILDHSIPATVQNSQLWMCQARRVSVVGFFGGKWGKLAMWWAQDLWFHRITPAKADRKLGDEMNEQ